jgi:hypothetical protein
VNSKEVLCPVPENEDAAGCGHFYTHSVEYPKANIAVRPAGNKSIVISSVGNFTAV